MIDWNKKFAGRTQHMKRSAIREILKLTQRPDIISFAGGLPAPELFPVERMKQAADVVLSERGPSALQYSTTEGMPELREAIARRMSTDKVTLTPEHVVIVSGAQQSIDLIGRVMLDGGDSIVVENPTYIGMLSAWRPYNLHYETIETDADGLLIDQLEAAFRKDPKLAYLIPNFQNPQGVTLSGERRVELVNLMNKYGVVVVEDNPYGELRYDGDPLPCLYELDAQANGLDNSHVVYAGTFSKLLAPGLRVGWVAGPPPIIERVVQAKQSADLHVSTLTQLITCEMVCGDFLDGHVATLRKMYKERRDVMLAAMDEHFPREARWSRPDGGMFLMVYLPEYIDAGELLVEAIEHKVAFVPGVDFHLGGVGRNSFRLNFSNAQPDQIQEGIKRLGVLLQQAVARG